MSEEIARFAPDAKKVCSNAQRPVAEVRVLDAKTIGHHHLAGIFTRR
jgi:hypothetical protein